MRLTKILNGLDRGAQKYVPGRQIRLRDRRREHHVFYLQAELERARYYLSNTLITAPEDGKVVNLQVCPGMVAGMFCLGAIASFNVDADRGSEL
jgi:multidrug resistance efflux pump